MFTISYDPVDTLASFANRYEIPFSMLSDVGSSVIKETGMLNPYVNEQHIAYGIEPDPRYEGVPYPATFFLDESGTIIDRRFHQSYRVREAGNTLVDRLLGIGAAPNIASTTTGELIAVRAWLDADRFRPYQQLQLHIEVTLAPDWHIYGHPTPDGFHPVEVDIDPVEGLVVGPAQWPTAEPFRIDGLDEEFLVHAGTVTAKIPLTFEMRKQGSVTIRGRLRFQMCNDRECLPPSSLPFELAIEEASHVPKAG